MVPLIDDPFLLALPPDHPLADLDEIPIAALAGEELIIGTPSTCPDSDVSMLACEAEGFTPERSYPVDDYGAALGLVAAGLAVAMVPELALTGRRRDVVVRPLDAHLVRRIVAMTLDTRTPSPVGEAMIAALADAASAHRLLDGGRTGLPAGA
jgi:DNA-binding transcriptional LysR family regulator